MKQFLLVSVAIAVVLLLSAASAFAPSPCFVLCGRAGDGFDKKRRTTQYKSSVAHDFWRTKG